MQSVCSEELGNSLCLRCPVFKWTAASQLQMSICNDLCGKINKTKYVVQITHISCCVSDADEE